MIPPPTHSIASVPIAGQRLQQLRDHVDQAAADGSRAAPPPLGQVQADVVELHDQADRAIDPDGDDDADGGERDRAHPEAEVGQLRERDGHDLGRQDEVGADGARDLALLELLGRVRLQQSRLRHDGRRGFSRGSSRSPSNTR